MSIWDKLNEAVENIAINENNKKQTLLSEAYSNAVGPTDKPKKIKTKEIAEIISVIAKDIYKFLQVPTGRNIISYDGGSNIIKIDTDFFNLKNVVGFTGFLPSITIKGNPIILSVETVGKGNRPKVKITAQLPNHKNTSTFYLAAGKGSVNQVGKIKQNKGNKFETDFVKGFYDYLTGDKYWEDIIVDGVNHGAFFKEFYEKILFPKYKNKLNFSIEGVGGLNNKRPITFSGGKIKVGDGRMDIGEIVTDVNLYCNGDVYYFSLKHGGTISLANLGVAGMLPEKDISSEKLNDKNGKALLKMFGVDEIKFCDTFNNYQTNLTGVDPRPADKQGRPFNVPLGLEKAKADKGAIDKLLQGVVGYGYWMVHLQGNKIIWYKSDKKKMKEKGTVANVLISYGGSTGAAKRVNIDVILTNGQVLKLAIRDSGGNSSYPSHLYFVPKG